MLGRLHGMPQAPQPTVLERPVHLWDELSLALGREVMMCVCEYVYGVSECRCTCDPAGTRKSRHDLQGVVHLVL